MRRLAACAVVLSLLGGCGISAEDQPKALPTESPTPAPSASERATVTKTTIYLVLKDRLSQQQRDTASSPSPQQVLDALQAPPSKLESLSGLTTGVIDAVVVDSSDAPPGVVTVQVPDQFLTEDKLAFGQIVLSLTRLTTGTGAVTGVRFVRDGKSIDVLDGNGRTVKGVLTRANYTSLLLAT